MDSAVRPEEICPEWSDDVRMRALFGPLPSQTAQPEAWSGRVRFWTGLIEAWASRAGPRCLLTTTELSRALARAGRTPQCLGEVVAAGRTEGLYAEPAAYLVQLERPRGKASSWGSWLLGLGWGAVRSVGAGLIGRAGQSDSSDTEFVVTKLVCKVKDISYLMLTFFSCNFFCMQPCLHFFLTDCSFSRYYVPVLFPVLCFLGYFVMGPVKFSNTSPNLTLKCQFALHLGRTGISVLPVVISYEVLVLLNDFNIYGCFFHGCGSISGLDPDSMIL
jgi:hypothetical protein